MVFEFIIVDDSITDAFKRAERDDMLWTVTWKNQLRRAATSELRRLEPHVESRSQQRRREDREQHNPALRARRWRSRSLAPHVQVRVHGVRGVHGHPRPSPRRCHQMGRHGSVAQPPLRDVPPQAPSEHTRRGRQSCCPRDGAPEPSLRRDQEATRDFVQQERPAERDAERPEGDLASKLPRSHCHVRF